MITESLLVALATAQREWPEQADLRPGEVLRSYERTMSRRGTFERIVVYTATKVFLKDGETRYFAMLTASQQSELSAIFKADPTELRSKKRANPMWPSTYDGTDQWMSYRIGRSTKTWTNDKYEFPEESTFGKFFASVHGQFSTGHLR